MKYKLIFDNIVTIPFEGRRLDNITLLECFSLPAGLYLKEQKFPVMFVCTFFAEWERYGDITPAFASLFESVNNAYYEDDGQLTRSFVLHECFRHLELATLQQAYINEKYVFDIDISQLLYKLTF